jgi:16S rRNA (cytosine1402-N4)-methyltransferase
MIKLADTYHVPVLLRESVDGLDIQPDGIYTDVTFGGGGHSKAMMQQIGAKGHLYSFDQDADAEKIMSEGQWPDNFTFVRSNFRYMKNWMRYYRVEHIDGVLADLGVSSHHFDDEERGFSFRHDAPLDMRMNQRAGTTAADILNGYSEEQLSNIFHIYGELKQAHRMVAAIVKARQQHPILTTGDLCRVLGDKYWAWDDESKAFQPLPTAKKELAKLFQALRIEVNHEMQALQEMLSAAIQLLRPGGRLSVITYHSLEDRIVKNMMRTGNVKGKLEQDFFGRSASPLRMVNNKVIVPTDDEIARNPRSRSAKLRVAEKVEN